MQLALRRLRTSSRPDAGPHLPALPVQCRVRKPPGSNVGAVSHSIPCIESHTEASYIAVCCWHLCVPPMHFLCRILQFHPSPKFTPAICHRLLPLPFGPLRVWIRSLRLSRYTTSGLLKNPRICLQLHRADNEMSFSSDLFLGRFRLLLSAYHISSPILILHQALLPQHSFTFQISLAPSECDRLSILHCLCEWAL